MRPEIEQAAALLRKNTPEATERAIGLLQNTVYSFSMKVCGHPEDAEDTTQEVLFRSIRHLAKITDPRALAVWLYTVTRNRCWRMRRRSANAPAHTFSIDELMPDDAELGRLLQDAALSPEGELLEAEQHQLLHQALLRIPAPLRIVLALHDMEDLPTDEVAQILGLHPGTVRVRLHRARLSIRKEVGRTAEASNRNSEVIKSSKTRNQKPATHRNRRPAECRELFSNLSDYLDGRLEPRTCDQMREHIEACPACVAFLRDLRSAIDRCRSMEVPCDPAVASRLRSILTREYLRMLGTPDLKKISGGV